MIEFARTLFFRQPVLSSVAWFHLALVIVMLIGLGFDDRSILGLNPWVKPMKFAASIAIYLFTMALFISYLPGQRTVLRAVSWIIALTMLLGIVLISVQSMRGTTSHFNVGSPLDAGIFGAMGIAITVNTVMAASILALYFLRSPGLSPSFLWGIRLGLLIFVVGSLQGFVMVSRMAHTVGAPDGGPGLPFVNWSTQNGDLRIAHFIGLHALQVVPLAGFLLGRRKQLPRESTTGAVVWVFAIAGLVAGFMAWFFLQALNGRPLVRLD